MTGKLTYSILILSFTGISKNRRLNIFGFLPPGNNWGQRGRWINKNHFYILFSLSPRWAAPAPWDAVAIPSGSKFLRVSSRSSWFKNPCRPRNPRFLFSSKHNRVLFQQGRQRNCFKAKSRSGRNSKMQIRLKFTSSKDSSLNLMVFAEHRLKANILCKSVPALWDAASAISQGLISV